MTPKTAIFIIFLQFLKSGGVWGNRAKMTPKRGKKWIFGTCALRTPPKIPRERVIRAKTPPKKGPFCLQIKNTNF